jgi:hypothetical protein
VQYALQCAPSCSATIAQTLVRLLPDGEWIADPYGNERRRSRRQSNWASMREGYQARGCRSIALLGDLISGSVGNRVDLEEHIRMKERRHLNGSARGRL